MASPLLTVAQVRALEAAALANTPPFELMQKAGRAVSEFIVRTRPTSAPSHIAVICGPGNNGGDGFVAANELRRAGNTVTCVLLGSERPKAGDAGSAFDQWIDGGGSIERELPIDRTFDVVIDAMFGIGLERPLAGAFLEAASWINRQACVVAIDVPSGLDADTGAWIDGVSGVLAHFTVTMIADKPGLHTGDGVDAAGKVIVEPLGMLDTSAAGTLVEPADFASVLAPRRRNSHKGQYGNIAVVGGSGGMVGAALLAARAALRLGAGRVFVDLIGAPEWRVDPIQPELMMRSEASIDSLDSIVIGCGLGTEAQSRGALCSALARDVSLVVDADALTIAAGDTEVRNAIRNRRAPTILTPHPLEAARLLGQSTHEVQSDRVAAATALSKEMASLVILKGAGTIIADQQRFAINPTGSPALATAGSGDVLAGMLGALLAQGHDRWEAALAAVYLHGCAGEAVGDVGLAAGEIASLAVESLRRLRGH